MQKVIEVRGLTKSFIGNIILDNLSFDIEKGIILGLIGKSGCGKTTLLKTLVGFVKPNRGIIFYNGESLESSNLKSHVGFASQEGSFYKNLNVNDNLRYFGRLYGLSKKEREHRIKVLLNTFSLSDASKTLAGNLSIGMQKRLDIACALIHDPQILLLDEPTANLDPILRKNILNLIKRINEEGKTVIISSHIMNDLTTLCHKVLVLNNKKIVAFDSPKNIEERFSEHKIIKLESERKDYLGLINNLYGVSTIKAHKANNSGLILFTKDVKDTLKHINNYYSRNNDNLIHIDVVKPSLELLFDNKYEGI